MCLFRRADQGAFLGVDQPAGGRLRVYRPQVRRCTG
nr:MAG TPA: hypothetical protein [Bacteriophage sp.]